MTVYPKTPLSEQIQVVKDLIQLFESNWKGRLEDAKRIGERTLPQLRDVLATLNLLMYGD